MTSVESSPLIEDASELYHEYDMNSLPVELRRDSRYFYYLSVYPGLKKMVDLTIDTLPELPEKVHSAYVHTPYCTGVCSFCSYFLTTVSNGDTSPIESYLETVKDEILQRSRETELDLSYLYFGGGTPSLIPVGALEKFFDFLDEHKVLNPTSYGTLELHPEFFSDLKRAQEFINILKANGVGRVSLGFQSSSQEVLNSTNRRHGTSFLQDAIEFLKQNDMLVNLDLIYGLPELSLEEWEKTLDEAVSCDPDSISTYFLFVNPRTAMHAQVKKGQVKLPSHQEIQTQHIMAQVHLGQHGFLELPNDFFARTADDTSAPTQDALPSSGASLPLGAGSYGYYDNTQFFNVLSISEHRERVGRGESPIWRGYRFDDNEGMHRDMMFSLKNSPYIDRNLFEQRYGIDPAEVFADTIENLVKYGLVNVDEALKRITLTTKGRLCVEEIACLFEVPNLPDNIAENLTRPERHKLEKHNFAPLYSMLKQDE